MKIEFDPNLTTIVGVSDVGKSSVLRAVRWACLNQPQGDAFIRTGSFESVVDFRADGHTITRLRSRDGENSYKLDGSELKSFGFGVPQSVENVVRVDQINFLDQHDPPFWFSLSAPEVSRQLNAVVDLGVIDEALERISSKVKRCASELVSAEAELKAAKNEREGLDWVDDAQAFFEQIEKLEALKSKTAERITGLESVTVSFNKAHEQRDLAADVLQDAESVEAVYAKVAELVRKVALISKLIFEIKENQQIAYRGDVDFQPVESCWISSGKQASRLEDLEILVSSARRNARKIKTDLPSFDGIDELFGIISEKTSRATSLGELKSRVRQYELEKFETQEDLLEFESELKQFEGELCPVCGGEIHGGAVS